MRIALRVYVIALLVSTVLLSGCGQSEPTPNIQATVQAAVATAVADQPEPTPSRAGTPMPAIAGTVMPVDVHTPEPGQPQPTRLILINGAHDAFGGYGYGYAKLQAIVAKENAQLTLPSKHEAWDEGVLDPEEQRAIIIVAGYGEFGEGPYFITEGILVDLHSYVNRGGRLIFFVHPNMSGFNILLQDTFKLLVIPENVTPTDTCELHADGTGLSSFWGD